MAMAFFYRYTTGHELTSSELLSIGSLCLVAFGLTHIFRIVFTKNKWIELPLPRLVIFVLLSNLCMAAVIASTNLLIDKVDIFRSCFV